LVMESHKVRLQTTMEKIKCLIRWPKLQPQMILQSLGKCIKQERDKSTSNQEPKKNWRGTYTQWFAPHLWVHIFLIMKKHKNLTNVLHYLFAFHKKPRIYTSPFHKLSFLG
jgi:hypothetical protein